MEFKVIRTRDDVELASFDNFDAAFSYAQTIVNVMRCHGECNVVACESEEEESTDNTILIDAPLWLGDEVCTV